MPGRFRQHDKSEIQSAVATHAHARAAQLVWHGLPCAEPLPVVHAKIGGVTQSGLTDPIRCPVTHDTGLDCSTQFSVLFGGNAALKPEQSEQATAGFVIDPIPNASFSVDYFKINLKNVSWMVFLRLPSSATWDNSQALSPARLPSRDPRSRAASRDDRGVLTTRSRLSCVRGVDGRRFH